MRGPSKPHFFGGAVVRRSAALLTIAFICGLSLPQFGTSEASSSCDASTYGGGADGPFTGGDPNTIRTPLSSSAAAGQTTIAVADSSGLPVGSEVFIHQVTGAGHGSFEFGCVAVQSLGSITLTSPLTQGYGQDTVARSQVIRVLHFAGVSGAISTSEWNGSTGGVVVFRALTVSGAAIDVSGKGFKGGYGNDAALHAGLCSWSSGQGQAQQGHSYTGVVSCAKTPNGGAGGGGGQPAFVESCEFGSGGGGGYGTAGGNGAGCAGGTGGGLYGTDDLSKIGLGSGGGGGTWGTNPYGGGRRSGDERSNDASGQGGGTALIISASITSTTVNANGIVGGPSSNGYAGGGGSGGAIKIVTNDVSAVSLQAVGGGGGSGGIASGGAGGAGRIRVEYCGTFAGSASPAASLQQLSCNTAPTANPDAYTVNEDATLSLPAPGVLANDSDPDGDALTAGLASGPANGTLALNGNGSFSYTPNANFNGTDSFSYRARDAAGAESAPAAVTITVSAVNDTPVAAPDSYSTNEDTTLSLAALGVLANDSDVDGDPLAAVLVSGPMNGTLVLSADGSFTYTPNPDFDRTDAFTYRASDGTVTSNTATVTITVSPLNDAPVAAPDTYSVDEDSMLTVAAPGVLTNDRDVDSATLTAVFVSGTAHGTLTLNANGSFSYTPVANYNGPDGFTYKASDGSTDSAPVVVTITVNPVPDADLSVTKSVTPNPAFVGDPVVYTIVVANAGPEPAVAVQLTDTVPAGVSVTSVTTTQGTCTGTGPIVCSLGTLVSGTTATVSVAATATASGSQTNTASATTTTPDPALANNSASATLQISPLGHDVGIAGGGFALSARHDLSRLGPVETVKIKLKNYSRMASETISYSVSSSVGGDTLSAGCFGTTPTLEPGKTYTVVGCTITYAGTGFRTVTLTTAHDDTDGAIDEDLTNNTASRSVTVQP